MELRHLRYFVAAAEEQHFGRAAERLSITRPAVSQLIADLESELDTQLFERLAHRVQLTAAGQTLLTRLQGIMADLNEALVLTKRVGRGKTGVLNIAYGSLTLHHSLFRAVIKRFNEMYPEVTLSLFEMSTTDMPRALAEERVHGGFMHFGPGRTLVRDYANEGESTQAETLDWFQIQSGGLGVAMSKDNPLAHRQSVTLADLAQERFVISPRSANSPGYGPLHTFCQKAGFEPNIAQEVHTIAMMLNLIAVGMGIGLVPTGRNFVYDERGLVVVPLDQINYLTTFGFGWVKGRTHPTLDRMVDIIKDLSSLGE